MSVPGAADGTRRRGSSSSSSRRISRLKEREVAGRPTPRDLSPRLHPRRRTCKNRRKCRSVLSYARCPAIGHFHAAVAESNFLVRVCRQDREGKAISNQPRPFSSTIKVKQRGTPRFPRLNSGEKKSQASLAITSRELHGTEKIRAMPDGRELVTTVCSISSFSLYKNILYRIRY